MTKRTETRPFDPAEFIDTAEGARAYLSEAFRTNDAAFIADALGVVARAHGMTELAAQTGLSRQSLYRALSPQGRPELPTLIKVLNALGVQLEPVALDG